MEKHFEQFFVFSILITLPIINYYFPHKIAFLNFYFLPVILAGYFMGIYRAVLGALFCILMVIIFAFFFPHFFHTSDNPFFIYLHITIWGGFLVLSGAVVGFQHKKLDKQFQNTRIMNEELLEKQTALNDTNRSLTQFNEKYSAKVMELELSKDAIDSLKTKVEETLYSTMDATVAKLIIEEKIRNEKRRIAVMFTDIVDFTSYSEDRPPEHVVRDLNSFLTFMEPIILGYKGHIDKYLGDGIMCEFGAPLNYENYQVLAVTAAYKMQEKLTRSEYPWQMRIGIASGPAIMGLIGSKRQSYTTIGDVVNLASRLENNCSPKSILISEDMYEGVRRFFHARLKRDIPLSETADKKSEAELEKLHQKLNEITDVNEKASLFYQIGKFHMSLGEFFDALRYFERALMAQPDNMEFKVTFAEAAVKKEESEKLKIKGKKERVAAYEVTGIKDILSDRNKIPDSFFEKYPDVEELITIPEDVIMPVEALDGCIGHSKVVAIISFAIASELGASEQEKKEILHAGYVADIGKEIVSHHLLNRMGSLSDSEIIQIKKHPIEGPYILRKMGYNSEMMLDIVRLSHENYDGSGYPDGLKGEEIPLGSRIISVADTYDALTSWRQYREKWDRSAAFEELTQAAEKGRLDPQVVKTLIRVLS